MGSYAAPSAGSKLPPSGPLAQSAADRYPFSQAQRYNVAPVSPTAPEPARAPHAANAASLRALLEAERAAVLARLKVMESARNVAGDGSAAAAADTQEAGYGMQQRPPLSARSMDANATRRGSDAIALAASASLHGSRPSSVGGASGISRRQAATALSNTGTPDVHASTARTPQDYTLSTELPGQQRHGSARSRRGELVSRGQEGSETVDAMAVSSSADVQPRITQSARSHRPEIGTERQSVVSRRAQMLPLSSSGTGIRLSEVTGAPVSFLEPEDEKIVALLSLPPHLQQNEYLARQLRHLADIRDIRLQQEQVRGEVELSRARRSLAAESGSEADEVEHLTWLAQQKRMLKEARIRRLLAQELGLDAAETARFIRQGPSMSSAAAAAASAGAGRSGSASHSYDSKDEPVRSHSARALPSNKDPGLRRILRRYDPAAGLLLYFDFALGLQPHVKEIQLAYCIYASGAAAMPPQSITVQPAEEYSHHSAVASHTGSRRSSAVDGGGAARGDASAGDSHSLLHRALIAQSRSLDGDAAADVYLVVEVQRIVRSPDGARVSLRSAGWTAVPLFRQIESVSDATSHSYSGGTYEPFGSHLSLPLFKPPVAGPAGATLDVLRHQPMLPDTRLYVRLLTAAEQAAVVDNVRTELHQQTLSLPPGSQTEPTAQEISAAAAAALAPSYDDAPKYISPFDVAFGPGTEASIPRLPRSTPASRGHSASALARDNSSSGFNFPPPPEVTAGPSGHSKRLSDGAGEQIIPGGSGEMHFAPSNCESRIGLLVDSVTVALGPASAGDAPLSLTAQWSDDGNIQKAGASTAGHEKALGVAEPSAKLHSTYEWYPVKASGDDGSLLTLSSIGPDLRSTLTSSAIESPHMILSIQLQKGGRRSSSSSGNTEEAGVRRRTLAHARFSLMDIIVSLLRVYGRDSAHQAAAEEPVVLDCSRAVTAAFDREALSRGVLRTHTVACQARLLLGPSQHAQDTDPVPPPAAVIMRVRLQVSAAALRRLLLCLLTTQPALTSGHSAPLPTPDLLHSDEPWIDRQHPLPTPVLGKPYFSLPFFVCVDGARFLPDNVLLSAVTACIVTSDGTQVAEWHACVDLDSDLLCPQYRNVALIQVGASDGIGEKSAEDKGTHLLVPVPAPMDASAVMLLRLDGIESHTGAVQTVGYALVPLFVRGSPDAAIPPMLLQGALQLPVHQQGPDLTQPITAGSLARAPRVPCTTLLIRVVEAADTAGTATPPLPPPAPAYNTGAYDSAVCKPLPAEVLMYPKRAARKSSTARQLLEEAYGAAADVLSATGGGGAVPQVCHPLVAASTGGIPAAALQRMPQLVTCVGIPPTPSSSTASLREWVRKRLAPNHSGSSSGGLKSPFPALNLRYLCSYDAALGFKLKVDAVHSLPAPPVHDKHQLPYVVSAAYTVVTCAEDIDRILTRVRRGTAPTADGGAGASTPAPAAASTAGVGVGSGVWRWTKARQWDAPCTLQRFNDAATLFTGIACSGTDDSSSQSKAGIGSFVVFLLLATRLPPVAIGGGRSHSASTLKAADVQASVVGYGLLPLFLSTGEPYLARGAHAVPIIAGPPNAAVLKGAVTASLPWHDVFAELLGFAPPTKGGFSSMASQLISERQQEEADEAAAAAVRAAKARKRGGLFGRKGSSSGGGLLSMFRSKRNTEDGAVAEVEGALPVEDDDGDEEDGGDTEDSPVLRAVPSDKQHDTSHPPLVRLLAGYPFMCVRLSDCQLQGVVSTPAVDYASPLVSSDGGWAYQWSAEPAIPSPTLNTLLPTRPDSGWWDAAIQAAVRDELAAPAY